MLDLVSYTIVFSSYDKFWYLWKNTIVSLPDTLNAQEKNVKIKN